MKIRHIKLSDYNDYIKLIDSKITFEYFESFINNTLNKNHIILVVIDKKLHNIIGTGTLLIEPKLTHDGCYMGHVENIFINSKYRHKGIGAKLVEELLNIAKKKCYKVSLNCNKILEKFYNINGFCYNGINMNILFKNNFK